MDIKRQQITPDKLTTSTPDKSKDNKSNSIKAKDNESQPDGTSTDKNTNKVKTIDIANEVITAAAIHKELRWQCKVCMKLNIEVYICSCNKAWLCGKDQLSHHVSETSCNACHETSPIYLNSLMYNGGGSGGSGGSVGGSGGSGGSGGNGGSGGSGGGSGGNGSGGGSGGGSSGSIGGSQINIEDIDPVYLKSNGSGSDGTAFSGVKDVSFTATQSRNDLLKSRQKSLGSAYLQKNETDDLENKWNQYLKSHSKWKCGCGSMNAQINTFCGSCRKKWHCKCKIVRDVKTSTSCEKCKEVVNYYQYQLMLASHQESKSNKWVCICKFMNGPRNCVAAKDVTEQSSDAPPSAVCQSCYDVWRCKCGDYKHVSVKSCTVCNEVLSDEILAIIKSLDTS